MSICRTIRDMYRISYWKYLNYFLFIFSFGEISPAPFPAIRIRFKCLFRSPFPAAGQDFAPLRNGHFLPGQQGKATRHPQVERPQRIGQARRTHQQDVRFISEFVFTTFCETGNYFYFLQANRENEHVWYFRSEYRKNFNVTRGDRVQPAWINNFEKVTIDGGDSRQ